MASSNRHWPSMFKSKPCNTHHQWQHDINPNLSSSTGCHRSSPYTTVNGCEERSPEPKPRWNPKPEQIRILEAIFNSGMVNPPRDEIRKIRGQLQEYGQVGDANVFYWFQNRKSRSKNKLRHIQNSKNNINNPQTQIQTTTQSITPHSATATAGATNTTTSATATATAAGSNSSSFSDKSSPKAAPSKTFASNMGFSNLSDVSNSQSVNSITHNYFLPNTTDLLPEPFFFPVSQTCGGVGGVGVGVGLNSNFNQAPQGFCFSELSNVVQQQVPEPGVGPCTTLLLNEIMNNNNTGIPKKDSDQEKLMVKIQQQQQPQFVMNYPASATFNPSTTSLTVPSPTNGIQGVGLGVGGEDCGVVMGGQSQSCIGKSTVFINGVAFEITAGPFNVREAFGDEAVLIHSTGHPVLTNEWGLTVHSLQHGASYYLI